MASNSAGKHNTNKVAFRKPMAATVFHFAMGLVLGFNVFAQGIETPSVGDTPGIIPLDPATFGYKVNNEELQFKEHVVLPKNMTIRGGGMLDSRYRLANLTIDEHGNYEQEKFKKSFLWIVCLATSSSHLTPEIFGVLWMETWPHGLIQANARTQFFLMENLGKRFRLGREPSSLMEWSSI